MAKTSVSPILQMIRRLAEDQCAKTLPDQELLRRFTSGQDEAAFGGLVRRHGAMVLDVCRKVAGNEADAEDAFQATFLILARKAKSIRNTASVGSWLHGVAYRTALNGRKEFARRQKHESRAPRYAARESADDLSWREVQYVIHAELAMLSERYRAPLVLCFLEGRTQDEAAKQLGICKATLKKRLERGRALVRGRLVRLGLGPATLLAASAWPTATAVACLPPTLAAATIKAATALAAGQATAGLVSGQVAYLVENALKATLATKLKIATAVVLALALVPTIGGWSFPSQWTRTVVAKGATVEPVPQAAASGRSRSRLARVEVDDAVLPGPQKTRTLSGRVLDSAGKPLAGAKLLLVGASAQPVDLGTSAADGRFAVVVPKSTMDNDPNRVDCYLVARIDGAGFAFIGLRGIVPTDPVELSVVRDLPIRGRVINTEGKPVAGAKVAATYVSVDNSLDSVLVEWKKRNPSGFARYVVEGIRLEEDSFLSATTGADGRFVLAGTGAERFVYLHIHSSGIAEAEVLMVNREGFDPKPYNQARADSVAMIQPYVLDDRLLNGPEMAVVAEAERPIRGVVKDIDTGKPRGGVKVRLTWNAKKLQPFRLTAVTDVQGRYEIHGARKAPAHTLEVANDPAAGFVGSQVNVADAPGYEPITADINVKKGVIITGRVIDVATKKPLPGFATVAVLAANTLAKDYPGSDPSIDYGGRVTTAEDGTFRVVTIPGPVVLMGGVDEQRMPQGQIAWYMYKPAAADPKYPECFSDKTGLSSTVFYGLKGSMSPLQGHFCKVLEVKPGTAVLAQDITVEPATALPVKIQDEAGRPLAGTWVTGIGPMDFYQPVRVMTESCSAFHLETGKPRLMVFYETTKNLVGTLRLKGDKKEPVTVRLGQPGKVKGRLLDADGKPVVKVLVELHFHDRTASEMHDKIHHANFVETDADGRFQFDKIIPGAKFSLSFSRGRQTFEPVMKLEERSLQAAGTLDVGDVKVKLKAEQDN